MRLSAVDAVCCRPEQEAGYVCVMTGWQEGARAPTGALRIGGAFGADRLLRTDSPTRQATFSSGL